MKNYDHKEIEAKWQKRWQEDGLYDTKDKVEGKENFYTLVEFPYPSGNLHIGHWYAFAVPDIFARFKRMQGFNVLYPIGFDSFGLPAENAAIKRGLDPQKWTYDNMDFMTGQLKSMGNMFDWSRKVVTSDSDYYRWTQWLFIELFKKSLAFKKKGLVNWCPSCQTVLANEQVVDGKCERCSTEVTKKDLEQWFFKTTAYAEKLLEGLDRVDWPESIKESQKNWIGKSIGAEFNFKLKAGSDTLEAVDVFTTRADTLFGVTYVVLSPEHELVNQLLSSQESKVENADEVKKYVEEAKRKTEIERTDAKKEKTGVELKGIKAISPATGEEVPVWVADYVLAQYGTGAVMAVPAHDERDFEFSKKYNLKIKRVVMDTWNDKYTTGEVEWEGDEFYTNPPFIAEGWIVNSFKFTGLKSDTQAREKITEKYGAKKTTYKLRDWLLSRQRYWGCPIPIVYDPEGKPHPVPEEHLPWDLPTDDIDLKPKGTSPLGSSKELKERTEKIFGKGWTPEVDTMDTFVDSSWYFLRYTDPNNTERPFDKLRAGNWMPVDRYSGGGEHTNMHLLYARFFHKALYDMGLVNEDEPFKNRMNRGLILGPDGQKMSKSKGNVIDPDEFVEKVGADTVKMYLAFIGPYNEVGQYPWDLGGIAGTRRFLERVWRLQDMIDGSAELSKDLEILFNQTIKKVSEDTENYKFNTAISQMMIFVNEIEKEKKISEDVYKTLLRLLAPFTPHITEEIWQTLGEKTSIHLEKWPDYDSSKLTSDTVTYAIQINGKVRAEVSVPRSTEENDVVEQAEKTKGIEERLAGKKVLKKVFVKERLVNFVVEI